MAGWWRTEFVVTNDAGNDPVRVSGVEATANILHVLGVQPFIGQPFTPDSIQRATTPQALISYRFWLTRFAGARDVIGKPIALNGSSYTIVGVMPAGFD